jgi:hypothetical protein
MQNPIGSIRHSNQPGRGRCPPLLGISRWWAVPSLPLAFKIIKNDKDLYCKSPLAMDREKIRNKEGVMLGKKI